MFRVVGIILLFLSSLDSFVGYVSRLIGVVNDVAKNVEFVRNFLL